MAFIDLGNRLKSVRMGLNLSQMEFAKKLEITDKTLRNYENGKNITVDFIKKVADLTNADFYYLLNGKNENNTNNTSNTSYQIDVLNIKASAGTGIENQIVEVIDTILLDKNLFKTPINPAKIKLIQVSGDSMFPTLNDGDFVLIDETKAYGVDGIYAINLHNQILIKRLKFRLDGSIQIISDNKEYEMEVYNPNETQIPLHIIGLKTLTIQR